MCLDCLSFKLSLKVLGSDCDNGNFDFIKKFTQIINDISNF
jgi:hypothetical protein